MPAATLESLEQRLIAMEQKFAQWETSQRSRPLLPLSGKPGSRERMLAAIAKIKPISQETATLINNAIQEAREHSIADSLSS